MRYLFVVYFSLSLCLCVQGQDDSSSVVISNDTISADSAKLDSAKLDTVPQKTEEELFLDSLNAIHNPPDKKARKKAKKQKAAEKEAEKEWAQEEDKKKKKKKEKPSSVAASPASSESGNNDPPPEPEGVEDSSSGTEVDSELSEPAEAEGKNEETIPAEPDVQQPGAADKASNNEDSPESNPVETESKSEATSQTGQEVESEKVGSSDLESEQVKSTEDTPSDANSDSNSEVNTAEGEFENEKATPDSTKTNKNVKNSPKAANTESVNEGNGDANNQDGGETSNETPATRHGNDNVGNQLEEEAEADEDVDEVSIELDDEDAPETTTTQDEASEEQDEVDDSNDQGSSENEIVTPSADTGETESDEASSDQESDMNKSEENTEQKEPKASKTKEPKTKEPKEPKEKEPFSITRYGYASLGAGYGFPIFIGDLKDKQSSNIGNKAKGTFHLTVEKRLTRYFGASIDFMNGRFVQHERSLDRNLNFSSKYTQVGLAGIVYLDWEDEDTDHLIPFVKAGFSYFKFDPYGDLQDASRTPYHYWTNGEIRDLPEFSADGTYLVENKSLSNTISRDYTYETQLTTSSDEGQTTYKRNSFAVPLTFGFTYKFWNPLSVRMYGQYNLLFTDYVDNHASGGNDSWMFLGFSVNYRFGVETKGAGSWTSARDGASGRPIDLSKLSDRDFRGVEDDDQDNDGVKDLIDRCPNTPDSIEVNSKGCPSDRDRDGVPDYLDKEPNSRSKIVDPWGVALKPENYAQMWEIRSNALDLEIKEILSDAFKRGSISGYDLYRINTIIREHSSENRSKVPPHLVVADTNKDGFISTNEITDSIDCYFEGTCEDINASTIIELIDYFFQQANQLDE